MVCLIPGNGGNLGKHNTPTPVLSQGSPTNHHGINTCETHFLPTPTRLPAACLPSSRTQRVGGTHSSDDRSWKVNASRDRKSLPRMSHLPADRLSDDIAVRPRPAPLHTFTAPGSKMLSRCLRQALRECPVLRVYSRYRAHAIE